MSDQRPTPRGRRALREENARLRAQVDQTAADLDALSLQVNTLRGEGREALARVADAEQLAAGSFAQLTSWRKYAEAVLRTSNGLREWNEWYAAALDLRDEDLQAANAAIARLQAQLDWVARLPKAEPEGEAAPAVEAALREQIADLRTRLDHAAELVDHVVRRLVVGGAPPPTEPSRTRLHLPLVLDSLADTGTPIDLVEEYPQLRARPTA